MQAISKLERAAILRLGLLIFLGILVFWMLLNFLPIANDYHYWYRPLAEYLYNGGVMYEGYLFYPPWTLYILLPYAGPHFSEPIGSALLNFTSLICLTLSLYLYQQFHRPPLYGILLGVLNIHMVDLLIHGQLDMFTLFGVMLGWWTVAKHKPYLLGLSFCLLLMKPYNVLLVGLLFLISIRKWPRGDIARSFLPPLFMVISSSWYVGFDWPLRYIANYKDPVSILAITIWRGMEQLGLPVWLPVIPALLAVATFVRLAWREGITERTLGIALATALTFAVYSHGHYYVLLIPVMLYVARRDWRVALFAYLMTWMPLLREPFGKEASWAGIAYPLVLLLALWFLPLNPAESEKEAGTGQDQIPAN